MKPDERGKRAKLAPQEPLTIGELSRRTALPVKTLRFWSDEGLLPPSSRSAAGYRLYAKEALARLDLVRTLRDADIPIDTIRKVLRRDLSLADALRLQLAAVEAHQASLARVAAALRAALRGDPDESDVRRLCAVTKLTHEERKQVIERFHARIAEGLVVDDAWRKKMLAEAAPRLPDDPTASQLDAWVELSELMADASFVEGLRDAAKQIQERNIDMNALRIANEQAGAAAASLRARGGTAGSEDARAIVSTYVAAVAGAMGKTDVDAAFTAMFRRRFAAHDPRNARYRELVALVEGKEATSGTAEDWRFLTEAIDLHTR